MHNKTRANFKFSSLFFVVAGKPNTLLINNEKGLKGKSSILSQLKSGNGQLENHSTFRPLSLLSLNDRRDHNVSFVSFSSSSCRRMSKNAIFKFPLISRCRLLWNVVAG